MLFLTLYGLWYGAFKKFSEKPITVASNTKCDGYQHRLLSIVYKFLGRNTRDNITHTVKESFSENQLLSNKLHKPKTRKIKKREIHSGC